MATRLKTDVSDGRHIKVHVMSDEQGAHIVDVSDDDATKYQLYVGQSRVALLTKCSMGVRLNWQIYGPQFWPEAEEVMAGLLSLSTLADQLYAEHLVERRSGVKKRSGVSHKGKGRIKKK